MSEQNTTEQSAADQGQPYPGLRIFITVVQEDGALEGQEIMQCRKVMLGDVRYPDDRKIARLYFEEIMRELVYERRRVVADEPSHD